MAGKAETVAAPSRLAATFASLGHKQFRLVWLGAICTWVGSQMQMIARGYLAYELTSSPMILGIVSAGFAIPMLGLSLFGGALADRMDRRRVIQVCQALAALTSLAVAALILTGVVNWVHLFIASAVQGAVFSFLVPARQSIIPAIVGRDQLTNAMALNTAAFSSTTLLAPAFAGILYAWVGPGGVYLIMAGLQALAVIFTQAMTPDVATGKIGGPGMGGQIKEGVRYVMGNHQLKLLLVIALGMTLLAMPFRFLMPVFVVDLYHRGPESLGLLVSLMGLGSVIGSLFVAYVGSWHRGVTLLIGALVSGVALLLVSVLPWYAVAAVVMVALGLGDALRRSLTMALLMEESKDGFQGRVMSLYTMNFGLMPLATLPAGAVSEWLGVQVAVGAQAILLILLSLWIMLREPALRRMA